jgi:hypothetical protein
MISGVPRRLEDGECPRSASSAYGDTEEKLRRTRPMKAILHIGVFCVIVLMMGAVGMALERR